MNESDLKNGDSISLKDFKRLGLDKNIVKGKGKSKRSSSVSNNPLASQVKSPIHSKYNAKKTLIDGILFDSKFEAERYCILNVMNKAKIISDLKLQVPYEIIMNNIKICTYIADFVYIKNGNIVVEDAKGVKTPEYRLKKKMMKAVHNIIIFETFKTQ
jgi:hypothetical protein